MQPIFTNETGKQKVDCTHSIKNKYAIKIGCPNGILFLFNIFRF